ncbi:hypothetical protein EON65_28190 [archaeon]|nr:MAG: hypothetical protein EON65_28190 [archaeon]
MSSVRDSLSGMTVIEYPTLYFCHTAALDKFRLLLHDPQQSATENTSDSMMVDVVTGHEVREEKQAAVRQSEQVTFSSDTHALSLLGDDTEVNLNGPNSLETSDAMNVSPLKKRTYGGLLNLDYASSSDDEDDMEEEREAEVEGCSTGVGADMSAFLPPPLPVGNAASKYGDFFKQLSALQQVAHGSVKKDSGDCEIEEGEVEEEESSEQGEDESASSSSAISEDDDSSSESDSGGSSEDKDD